MTMFSEKPLVERKEHLDLMLGVPTTPVGVANRMVDLARQTGRTMELVRALPADGKAVVFAWNRSGIDHIKWTIRDHREGYPIKNLRFFTYEQWKNARIHGMGPMPAFIDNQVLDMLSIEVVEWVNRFFERKPE